MTKDDLIEGARNLLKDARHWTVIEAADRADTGEHLAMAILDFFGKTTFPCLPNCAECFDHQKNLA